MDTKPKRASFVEFDIPAEIEARPLLQNAGRLRRPTQEMANSLSKGLLDARNASPPSSPLRTRAPTDPPRRVVKTPNTRARGDERARQYRYGPSARRLSADYELLSREGWRDTGGLLRLLAKHLGACFENHMEGSTRPM